MLLMLSLQLAVEYDTPELIMQHNGYGELTNFVRIMSILTNTFKNYWELKWLNVVKYVKN